MFICSEEVRSGGVHSEHIGALLHKILEEGQTGDTMSLYAKATQRIFGCILLGCGPWPWMSLWRSMLSRATGYTLVTTKKSAAFPRKDACAYVQ